MPGSSISALTHFGISKAQSAQINCENPGTNDGLNGYLTNRPGTECMLSVDDLILGQDPFITCLVARQHGGPVEPPEDPWRGRCTAIDCEDGDDCQPPAPEDTPDDEPDTTGDTDADGDTDEDDDCSASCEAKQVGTEHKPEAHDAVESTFGDAHCPGCLQPGWEQALDAIIDNPPNITVNGNVDLNPEGTSGTLGRTTVNPDNSGLTISLDPSEISTEAYTRAAMHYGLDDAAACMADPICTAGAQNTYLPQVQVEALQHEYGHVLMISALAAGSVFTDAATGAGGYFAIFNYQWEELFGEGNRIFEFVGFRRHSAHLSQRIT